MGFFSNLFGSNKPKPEAHHNPQPQARPQQPATQEGEGPSKLSLMLLYDRTPALQQESLAAEIKQRMGAAVTDVTLVGEGGSFLGKVAFGDDEITLAGLGMPFPTQVLKPILAVCHFPEAAKAKLLDSQVHILLSYKSSSTSPIEQFDRLYQVMAAMQQLAPGALGVVNESAMTAHPADMIPNVAQERGQLAGPAMPFGSWLAWTGACVKYILDANTIWFVTKGNHQFGLPELAFCGGPKDGNDTMGLFNGLFAYMYFYKAVLLPGHTADLGAHKLRFSELQQYQDLMMGKFGTLVVSNR